MKRLAIALCLTFVVSSEGAENASVSNSQLFNSQPFNFSTHSYTNHAGNVVSGVVIALDARTVTISNATETVKLPLSIFPESEISSFAKATEDKLVCCVFRSP